jgi:hypothetical protein
MPETMEDMLFMQSACDYYVAARFVMYAQSVPLVGIMFHHAVERFLKGGLAQKRQLCDLKNIGHDLNKLWKAFKEDFSDAATDLKPAIDLTQHDKTISSVNKFEAVRYVDGISKYGMMVTADWSGRASEGKTFVGLKTPKQYQIVVSDIDDLVVDLFKVCSRNPVAFFSRANPHGLEALTRNNAHAEFLTKPAPSTSVTTPAA